MKKKSIAELRELLEKRFAEHRGKLEADASSELSEVLANCPFVTDPAVTDLNDAIVDTIKTIFTTGDLPTPFPLSIADDCAAVLGKNISVQYEGWHLAKDIEDSAIKAAEHQIVSGPIEKLDHFRDDSMRNRIAYDEESFTLYHTVHRNLLNLLVVLLPLTREFNARKGFGLLYKNWALLKAEYNRNLPITDPLRLQLIAETMAEGLHELEIARAYENVGDLDSFIGANGPSLAEMYGIDLPAANKARKSVNRNKKASEQ